MFTAARIPAHARLLLGMAMMIASAPPATAASWRAYHNDRFGATADVPTNWKPLPPPSNGDGLVFESPDGRATITVSGILATGSVEDEIAERLSPGDSEKVTYSKANASTVVTSGFKGDTIFYRRSIAGCRGTLWNSVSINYPAAQKALYDGIVLRASASLRNGRGWMCR